MAESPKNWRQCHVKNFNSENTKKPGYKWRHCFLTLLPHFNIRRKQITSQHLRQKWAKNKSKCHSYPHCQHYHYKLTEVSSLSLITYFLQETVQTNAITKNISNLVKLLKKNNPPVFYFIFQTLFIYGFL